MLLGIHRICNYVREISNQETQFVRDRSRNSYPRQQNPAAWITNTCVFDQWSEGSPNRCLYINWDDHSNDVVSLDKIMQAADGVFVASPHSTLHCVSVDWRNYARFDKMLQEGCDDTDTSKQIGHRRPPNPKEIGVAFACLLLSHQADDSELTERINRLTETAKCILEVLASQSIMSKQSRADYLELLKEHSDDAICRLMLQSSMRLPSNSLLLLSISNIQDLRYAMLDDMLANCCVLFRSEPTRLMQLLVFAHILEPVPGSSPFLLIDRYTEYHGESEKETTGFEKTK